MNRKEQAIVQFWSGLGTRFLPFADAATAELPLPRLLRLSLFQISVGMAMVLLTGAVNRVMIVELSVPAWLVALMVSLPLVFAPLRALMGHRSDTHRSVFGWRRAPYVWFGSLMQFGGFAIMPFALLILGGDAVGPIWVGQAGAALAFLMVGAGFHMTQTAGLALAMDLAPDASRPRVVALLYVTLLVGMAVSALVFGALLRDFTPVLLIQVIQGAAMVTVGLNLVALWKQEPRRKSTIDAPPSPGFAESWRALISNGRTHRLLAAVGFGAAGFAMQDILLEPYGAEVLGLTVSETTFLTFLFAGGSLLSFAGAARWLSRGAEPHRLASMGVLVGICGFSAVIFADPFRSASLFRAGSALIGFGGGLFAVSTLTAVMRLPRVPGVDSGVILGAWGAVHASAAGVGIAVGGALRDIIAELAVSGRLGPALDSTAASYGIVYHLEIFLLFLTLAAVGPLARLGGHETNAPDEKFGLAAFPG